MKITMRITLLLLTGFGLSACATTGITPAQSAFWSDDEDQYVAPEKHPATGLANPHFYMGGGDPDLQKMLSSFPSW
jgi:hypothetical protein